MFQIPGLQKEHPTLQENDSNNNFHVQPSTTYAFHNPPLNNHQPHFDQAAMPIDTKPRDLTNCRTAVSEFEGDAKGVEIKTEGDDRGGREEDVGRDEEEEVKKEKKMKPFKCLDCGKVFSQLRNYKYHR